MEKNCYANENSAFLSPSTHILMRQSFLGKKNYLNATLKKVSKTCTKMYIHCFKKRVPGTFSPILKYMNYIQSSFRKIVYSKPTIYL